VKSFLAIFSTVSIWFGCYQIAILYAALALLGLSIILVVGRDYRNSKAGLKRDRARRGKA
jgi:hypothetical protein